MKPGIDMWFSWITPTLQTVVIIAFALAVPRVVNAVTITVNSTAQSPGASGDCTLGEAISAANTDARVDACPGGRGADIITLPRGTYTLDRVNNTTSDGPNGLPSITAEITINGAGADITTVIRNPTDPDAPNFRIFHVASTGTLTLRAMGITRGLIEGETEGAGIFNSNGGTVTITNSIIVENRRGAIRNNGIMMISESTVTQNFEGREGAISNSGNLSIINSTVSFNESSSGVGGIFGSVGGIGNTGTLTITNSTIFDNIGGSAGGIRNDGGTVNISNNTISRNEATQSNFGGGILSSSTSSNVGTVKLQNTILIRNAARGNSQSSDCFGPITSLGNNFFNTSIRTSGTPSDSSDDCAIILQPSDLDGDPGTGNFTDDGTPGNGHFPLLPNSRAIDAGNNTSCPPTDQLGRQRACLCDIGAVEFLPAQTVDVVNATGLINAIRAANTSNSYRVINLESGSYNLSAIHNTPNGPSGLPSITSRICLKGTGAGTTTIQRNSNRLFRILHVAPAGVLTLHELTIRNGNSPDSDSGGGGIFNSGMLTLLDSTVSDNMATGSSGEPGGDGRGGGGISNSGTAVLTNTTVSDNESTSSGGGIENFRTRENLGVLTLINSTVSANTAEFDGGGIENSGDATVSTSTFNDNRANRFGGGINNFSSSLGLATFDLTNSTINNNTASLDGGGFENSAQAFLINSTISGNIAGRNGSGVGNFATGDEPGSIFMNNVTITLNRPSAGRVAAVFNAAGNIVNVLNTIIAQNTSGDCEGIFISRGFNLVGRGCTGFGTQEVSTNPMLDAVLRDNGGSTRTHALLTGSAAIDRGNPAAPGSSETACEPTDQRGFSRPVDGPDPGSTATCDIGAFEFGMRIVNSMVQFAAPATSSPITSDDTQTCPFGFVGEFRLVRRLTNTSTRSVSDLIVEVETLTNGNLLQNADEGPTGRRARLSIPMDDGFSDGVLGPNEFVDVPLIICLNDRNRFRFFVNVFGIAQ